MRLRVTAAASVITLLIALVAVGVAVVAQENPPPDQSTLCFASEALSTAQTSCGSVGVNQVCLGLGSVSADGRDLSETALDLDGLTSVTSTTGSLALIKLQADSPEDQPLRMVLFGDATIANAFEPLEEPYPTISVKNNSGNVLNLRSEPNTDADVIGTMSWSEELPADGRSADGEWLHLDRSPRADGWVFASLVTPAEGSDSTLYTLDNALTQPMQSLTLSSAPGDCSGGLLVQSASTDTAHLQVNGALLSFSSATLLLRAQADQALTVQVVNGSADLRSNGETVSAATGSEIDVALDQLDAAAAPEFKDQYAFASLVGAPLGVLPQGSLVCVAGVDSSAAILYSAPGSDAQTAGEIDASGNGTITGQAITDDGTVWWLVDDAGWISQDSVATAGVCGAVEVVAADVLQQQANVNISRPPQSTANDYSLLTANQSIWQAHTGADNLSGTCISPPIAQCDHLAAITIQPDGSIAWRGQEPLPYTMQSTGSNSFYYNGRSGLNNAKLAFSFTLTSESSWVGTMEYVFDSDPACTHTFYYTADKIQ